jgi:hypothetical protein
MKFIPKGILMLTLPCMFASAFAQDTDRSIPTAMSYLLTRPDARSSGMGDVGVATPTDANALYANPAKIVFSQNKAEMNLSHLPLMPYLTDDVSLSNFSAFKKMNDKSALGLSIYYLSYGKIVGMDGQGFFTQNIYPIEYTIDMSYARKMSNHFSLALSARYLHSDINDGVSNGIEVDPSNAFAMDVGAYFQKEQLSGAEGARWAFGVMISNIGTKVKYTQSKTQFLPTSFRLGAAYSFLADRSKQRLTFSTELNKLLVPTPPEYDSNGQIVAGKDPNRSVVSAIFTSFGDAPGGLAEEWREISIGTGLEYLLDETFAFRTGYFYEHEDKGNRQHFALGSGVKYRNFNFDLAYIIPTANRFVLKNSIKLSLGMNIK